MRRRHRGKPTKRLRSSSKKTNRYTGQLTGYCCWVGFVKFNITVSILFLQNSIFTCLTHVGATVADCTHEKCVRTTVTARHQELMQRHEVPTNSLQASWHRTVEKAGLSAFMGYYGAWLQNMWERGGQTDTTICVREPHTHTHRHHAEAGRPLAGVCAWLFLTSTHVKKTKKTQTCDLVHLWLLRTSWLSLVFILHMTYFFFFSLSFCIIRPHHPLWKLISSN